MATGVPLSDYSAISGVNYDTLAAFKQAGLDRVYQAKKAKNDRIRDSLKEAEENRLINQENTGKIAGLLNSNPELMTQINSGVAPDVVTKAYKSYQKGGGNLNSTALLANYLGSSADQLQANKILAFEQERQRNSDITALANAEARRIAAITEANKPQPLRIPAELVEQHKAKNPNAKYTPYADGTVAVDSFGGSVSGSDGKLSEWMSNEDILKLQQDTGLTYVQYPGKDPSGSGKAGARLGRSLAPDEQPILMEFEQKTAEGFQDKALEWTADGSLPRETAKSNLTVFEDAVTALEAGNVVTGTTLEKVNGILSLIGADDPIRAFFNPDGQNQLDNVRGVVFQGLRATLGSQFTEKEGLRLVEATYNTKLSPQANARRLRRLAQLLRDSIEYKDKLSELSLTRDGVISLVTQGGPRTRNWLNSQIDIMEQEFRQADGLDGVSSEPTDPNYKPPIVIPDDVKSRMDLYLNL